RTITADKSVREAEKDMKKYGHNGFVVISEKGIEGVFSRNDIDKVKGHGLMHAPVKSYMSKNIITIDADASVDEARDLMVKNAVGRIPVLENDKLIGIVTRSDILAAYYGSETPYHYKHKYGSSLVNIEKKEEDFLPYLKKLDKDIFQILLKAGELADSHNVEAYLIGGMVRDLLIGRKSRDLDIVVDGSIKDYIIALAGEFAADYTYNQEFKTGTIVFQNGFNIDLASSRKEIYQYTGALPEVERSNIVADLFRRDYTVNTLAVSLNSARFALLIDFFGGKEDVEKGILRALHRFSFLDDPTRIIRGIRMAERFNFTFEKETEALIKETLNTADFSRLSEARVIKEIQLLFEEPLSQELINIFKELSIFNLLDLYIEIKKEFYKDAKDLETYLEQLDKKTYNNIEVWVLRLAIFTEDISLDNIKDWSIKDKFKEILSAYSEKNYLLNKLSQKLDPVELIILLSGLDIEILIILSIKSRSQEVQENIRNYLENLQKVKININGHDLMEMGLEAGPEIKEILNKVYYARLRGEVHNRQDELSYAKNLIEDKEYDQI
ncbi:MAG: CBS domain-containing protein, partial [Bacillota bacterium]